MARAVNRGEIRSYRFKAPGKLRPVVAFSQQEVIPLLHTVTVAPITSTRRGAPSEVELGPDEGLKHESAANLDHVQTVERNRLTTFVGTVGPAKMRRICQRSRSQPAARKDWVSPLARAAGFWYAHRTMPLAAGARLGRYVIEALWRRRHGGRLSRRRYGPPAARGAQTAAGRNGRRRHCPPAARA